MINLVRPTSSFSVSSDRLSCDAHDAQDANANGQTSRTLCVCVHVGANDRLCARAYAYAWPLHDANANDLACDRASLCGHACSNDRGRVCAYAYFRAYDDDSVDARDDDGTSDVFHRVMRPPPDPLRSARVNTFVKERKTTC